MSRVVLRCPSCGTTKAAPGECEACHEAEVRYYCTNHSPGRWLDTPSCPDCGSRFGVPDRPAPAPPPPGRARRPPPAVSPTPTAHRPAPVEPSPDTRVRRKRPLSWPPGGPWGRRTLPRDEGETRPRGDALRDALERGLPELLREAARARRAREWDRPPIALAAAAGCLRFALLLLFFMLAFFAISIFLGGALMY